MLCLHLIEPDCNRNFEVYFCRRNFLFPFAAYTSVIFCIYPQWKRTISWGTILGYILYYFPGLDVLFFMARSKISLWLGD